MLQRGDSNGCWARWRSMLSSGWDRHLGSMVSSGRGSSEDSPQGCKMTLSVQNRSRNGCELFQCPFCHRNFLSDSVLKAGCGLSTLCCGDYAEGPERRLFLHRLPKRTVECMISRPLLDSHVPSPKFSGKYLMSPSYLFLKAHVRKWQSLLGSCRY